MTAGATGDHAVVLARGTSSRMGRPKGLVTLPGDGSTFLQRIVALYRRSGIPVTVVTLPAVVSSYRAVLAATGGAGVVAAPAGGDTARTLLAGWQSFDSATERIERIWAHPVDLPLVKPATLPLLAAAAREHPGRIVRPVYAGTPGHPVLVPVGVLEILAAHPECADDKLQSFFTRGTAAGWFPDVVAVAVADAGVSSDFDTPADLRHYERREDP